MPALAFLITFSAYGTHLPGSDKGWVDAGHCIPGSPMRSPDPFRESSWRAAMLETPWVLDHDDRLLVLGAMMTVCRYRAWNVHAVHVRTSHAHAVISGGVKPERMLCDFKAYATRALRSQHPELQRGRFWTRHGSTRYLWDEISVRRAVDYVLRGQGEPMARHPEVLAIDTDDRR